MIPQILNEVRETCTVVGPTDDIVLTGQTTDKFPFSNFLLDLDTVLYKVADYNGNWESGIGEYNIFTNALKRLTVISSSNADTYVDFPAGLKIIYSALDGKIAAQMIENIAYPYW